MRTLALVTNVALLGVASMTAVAEARDLRVGVDAPTIQAAIDAAANGDRVVVPAGVYRENIDLKGRAITLFGEAGAAGTILDGDAPYDPVVKIESGEGRGTIVQGLTIRGAQYDGVRVTDSSPTIRDCIVAWNGRTWGTGVSLSNSGARVERCAIVGNVHGGVGVVSPVGAEIVGNEIRGNGSPSFSTNDGGGVSVFNNPYSGSALVERNRIRDNSTMRSGGGLYVFGPATVAGNEIAGNSASSGGGVCWLIAETSQPHVLTGNTITANAAVDGTALVLDLGYARTSDVRVAGNVLAGPSAAVRCDTPWFPTVSLSFSCNDMWSGGAPSWTGTLADPTGFDGNVSVDPRFVAPAAADFRLSAGSPCVDAGDAAAAGLPSTDMFGATRPLDGDGDGSAVPDVGAYEFTGAPRVAAVRLDQGAADVPEDGGPLTLTVRRDGGDLPAASVHVRAAMLGATDGADVGPLDVVATFAAGETTTDVVVPIADDGIFTPAEFLVASLDRPDAGCVVGLCGAAALRVVDAPALVANYFPLPPGTRWYYRQSNGAVTYAEVLPGHPRVRGVATTVLKNTADHSRMYLTLDDLGLRLHRISVPGVPLGSYGRRNVTITFVPPVELARARVQMIDPWSATYSTSGGSAVLEVSGLGRLGTDWSATFTARRADVTVVDGLSAPFDPLAVEGSILLAGEPLHLDYVLGPGIGIVRSDDADTGDSAVLIDTTLGRHAPSIDAVGVPRLVRLHKKPVKARVDVIVRNRGDRDEVIEDAAMLDAFVSLESVSLGGVAAPAIARVARTKFPVVVRAGKAVHFRFVATVTSANDPARGAGHEDVRLTATVTPAALDRFKASPLLPPVAAPVSAEALLDVLVK